MPQNAAAEAAPAPVPPVAPPVAKQVPTTRVHHLDTVLDPYTWLADKDDPEVIAYLEAENAYTQSRTAHLEPLRETLFTEIKSRVQESDLSVPSRKGDWWYYARTVEGSQYGIYCRRAARDGETVLDLLGATGSKDGNPLDGEVILLDVNELAQGHDFFSLGAYDVSPDGWLLAYSTDTTGDERFTLRVKDLRTGELLADEVSGVAYGSAWSLEADVLFYARVDDAWRPFQIFRHALGMPESDDVLVLEEPDERFWVGIGLTRSQRYLVVDLHSNQTSEVRVIPADDPTAEPVMVSARRQGVEYSVEHQIGPSGGQFLVLHNDSTRGGGMNFAISTASALTPDEWSVLVPHRDDTRLLGVGAFTGHLVVSLRRDGLTGLRVVPLDADGALGETYDVQFPEPIYTVSGAGNPEYDTAVYRLGYTSLVTPSTVYELDVRTQELTLLKQTPVLGGFDPALYEQHREWAVAEDGARVPLSIVLRKDTPRDGTAPCLLYGYGSYESSTDPWFSAGRLSLLDRGVVFAVAHVRGGGEMGRAWYEDGKLLRKKNTFNDFVACAGALSEAGWTSADRLVARGGSAGGLLMGAIANLAPEAFRAIVAEVPFVDALTTILDPSLPLTVIEWEEWGNPLEDAEAYAYIKSYTPYENLQEVDYPAILAVTSLNDTRVMYTEPAKWVARLRAVASGGDVLLKTEMAAGHGGRSGRYDAWREEAFVLAWVLEQVGRS